MSDFDNQDIETIIVSVTVLAKRNVKNVKKIAKLLHQLLTAAPGDTLKKRKSFIVERFSGKSGTDSYLRRMLHAAEFEMVNELEPATLNEYQARLIVEHTKDSELRLDILIVP